MPIRVLEPTVAAQIAAGEVVERPASVVKELVENAVDAGARRITVSVRGGGIEELIIQDDGGGIAADEVTTAFERHATSKLTSADDLWAINTLGFRGEALPSIAAVSQVICVSRVASAEAGVELRVAGGEVQHIAPRGGPPGTTFTIRNLFYNIPVRREFLKSPGAEATAIASVVTQYALAYPQVAFTMVRDGKRVFQTSGRGQLADVLLELYGVDVARQMLPVDARGGEDLGAVHVHGLVSAPTLSRSARDGMHLTVNGRAIQPRSVVGTIIEEAYHTLLMKGRFPLVVLHVQVHPAAVDVNVHPTKSEVKFRNLPHIERVLGQAVRAVVQSTVVIQGWADPASADVAAPIASPITAAPPIANMPAPAEIDVFALDDDDLPAQQTGFATPTAPVSLRNSYWQPQPARRPSSPIQARFAEQPPVREERDDSEYQSSAPEDDSPTIDETIRPSSFGSRLPEDSSTLSDNSIPAPTLNSQLPSPTLLREAPAAETYQPAAPSYAIGPALPPLRALAQLTLTYLLSEGPGGALYLIDQHAAHERITYERLLAQHGAGAVQSQALLLPQHVALPPDAQQALLAAYAELTDWGFVVEEAERGVDVSAVPAGLAIEQLAITLADLANHLGGRGGQTPADRRDALLATLACHTSVRAGQSLNLIEQQALIDQLAGCEGPRTCPHGRPTLIVLTKHQLERQFGRLGA